MPNEPFVFKWKAFLLALFALSMPLIFIYIRTKSSTDSENAELLKKIAFFVNNFILNFLSLCVCMVSLKLYYWYINSNHISEYYKELFGTGIQLPFILWGLGVVIRKMYKGVLKIFKIEDVLDESAKETVLTISLLVLACSFLSAVDLKDGQVQSQLMFLFFILAVIIGKFVWLDTTYSKLMEQMKKMWKYNKYNILIGCLALLIMFIIWTIPRYIELNTVVSFVFGLLVALLLLTGKAIYDFKNNI